MSFFCCKSTLIFLYESNYFTKKLLICVQNACFCSILQRKFNIELQSQVRV